MFFPLRIFYFLPLFLSYINKFSDLGKRKAIEMLLKNCDFQKAELIKDEFNLKLQITKF